MDRTIQLKCPKGHTKTVGLEYAGRSIICEHCGHVWWVPPLSTLIPPKELEALQASGRGAGPAGAPAASQIPPGLYVVIAIVLIGGFLAVAKAIQRRNTPTYDNSAAEEAERQRMMQDEMANMQSKMGGNQAPVSQEEMRERTMQQQGSQQPRPPGGMPGGGQFPSAPRPPSGPPAGMPPGGGFPGGGQQPPPGGGFPPR